MSRLMNKHVVFYSVLLCCILFLVCLVWIKDKERWHQRVWMQSLVFDAYVSIYSDLDRFSIEKAKKKMLCGMSVNIKEIEGWKPRLVDVPFHHQSKEGLLKSIQLSIDYAKTLPNTHDIDDPKYFKANCMPSSSRQRL